jgi:GGDEF domain-containing protein
MNGGGARVLRFDGELTGADSFLDTLDDACATYRRDRAVAAILLIDLHVLGVSSIDTDLHSEIARHLRRSLRQGDIVSLIEPALLGCVLRDLLATAEIDIIAERIFARLGQPFAMRGGDSIAVSFSAGIARLPEDGQTVRVLLGKARNALAGARTADRRRAGVTSIVDAAE